MASRVGMAMRADAAQDRISTALEALSEQRGVTIPAVPVVRRDPILEPTLRLEWIADTLEQLATAATTADGEGGDPPSLRESEPSVVTSEKETDIAPEKTTTTPKKGGRA